MLRNDVKAVQNYMESVKNFSVRIFAKDGHRLTKIFLTLLANGTRSKEKMGEYEYQ
jgi:hypothetical protein